MHYINDLLSFWGVSTHYIPVLSFAICFTAIIVIAYAAHILFKIYLNRKVRSYIDNKGSFWARPIIESKFVHRLSHLMPALIIYASVPILESNNLSIASSIINFIQSVMLLYIIVAFISVLNAIITIIESLYKRQNVSRRKPIKSYLQVIRILAYFIAVILSISIILGESPLALFTGLGAMTAILLVVFKDTILGFVASIQLSSYDMVRVGDWVVLPKYDVDGDVIEISLNTVKIQNFDKTITTVPTSSLLSEGMTNWRGMEESGGRRIKRSLNIDMHSIKFCDDQLLGKLSSLHYLTDYIEKKSTEIGNYNESHHVNKQDNIANGRHLTNIGLFRAYTEKYILEHPKNS